METPKLWNAHPSGHVRIVSFMHCLYEAWPAVCAPIFSFLDRFGMKQSLDNMWVSMNRGFPNGWFRMEIPSKWMIYGHPQEIRKAPDEATKMRRSGQVRYSGRVAEAWERQCCSPAALGHGMSEPRRSTPRTNSTNGAVASGLSGQLVARSCFGFLCSIWN